MKNPMAVGAIIGAIIAVVGTMLLMGHLEKTTFTKVAEGVRPIKLGSIESVNATNERYTVSNENVWYNIISMPLDEEEVQYVLDSFNEIYDEGEIEGQAVYFIYVSSEMKNLNSIGWYTDSKLYIISTDAPEAVDKTLRALFKFYNGL